MFNMLLAKVLPLLAYCPQWAKRAIRWKFVNFFGNNDQLIVVEGLLEAYTKLNIIMKYFLKTDF